MRSHDGERRLQPLAAHHLAALQQYASSPAIAATTRVPHPYPPDGARTFLALAERERREGSAFVFAIEQRGEFVGVIGLHGVCATTAELGFWVAVPHQRRGHATFAVREVLRLAFDELRLPALFADALATNVASQRVLEAAGFVAVGERAHGHAGWPAHVPLRRYELGAAAWRAGC